MPDFEIKGDPGGIRSRARTMVKKADLFSGTGSALRDLDTKEGWYGRSADRFGDKNDQEPSRWWEAGGAFRSGGAALNAYADALEHAQNEARRAKEEYQRGEDATREAKAAYAEYEGRYNKLKSQAIADGLAYPWAKEAFTDPGDELRKNALEIFAAAKRGREDAARICAVDVRSACRNAPEKRNWLENALHHGAEVATGAGEAVLDLVKIAFYGSVAPALPMVYSFEGALTDLGLVDGRTTEEMLAKAELTAEDAENMWKAAKKDPKAFGEQLGKGLIDWDTWADNPARAIGHLVPDIVAGILTGGTATAASRGLRMGADAIDAVNDMSRAAGGLNRAADAVDALGDSMNVTKKLFGSGVPTPDVPDLEAPNARGIDAPRTPDNPGTSGVSEALRAPAGSAPDAPAVHGSTPESHAATQPTHGSAPNPDSSAAPDLPGHGTPGSDSSNNPMNHLESRLGTVSDTSHSFLENRLGGLGDVTPSPAPHDTPHSPLGDDPTRPVHGADLDDKSALGDDSQADDRSRSDPTHDGGGDASANHDVDSHDAADGGRVQPGEDPVHVDDHVKPEEKLNRDDYPNTQDYAGEAYNRINPYLRGEYDTAPFMDADDMIVGVKRELDSLPPTQEVSHRGMYMERSAVDRLFGGERFSDPAFLSTTKSPDVASNWVDELHDNRSPDAAPRDKVLLRVEGHSGRDISDISLNPGEKEILFKPATEFDVVGRHWNDAEGRWEIDLREVGHPDPGGSHADDLLDGSRPDSHADGSHTDPDADSPEHADSNDPESSTTDWPSEWGTGQYDPLLDGHFPHLQTPEPMLDSIKNVNEVGYWADPDRYGNNCHNVVEALELRARGYDVTAAPTVQSVRFEQLTEGQLGPVNMVDSFEGRHLPNIASDWRAPDGSAGKFEFLSDYSKESPGEALSKMTESWPDDARGFISGQWKDGGAHIFSIHKGPDGIELIDGQIDKPDASEYLDMMRFNERSVEQPWADLRVMRIDNLEPTEHVLGSARPRTMDEYHEAVAWGEAIHHGDPAGLPSESVQREITAHATWRERNEELIEHFREIASDPSKSISERNEAAGMIPSLQDQIHRMEWGKYRFLTDLHEAKFNLGGPG
ncbi:putative T7SS-secreted protein [Nocardioides sp. NPDC051685]|uniref:putative T7SS-secreted protein n=1 Tax=Nocardioides sp. NPDC051685 TaxID=3364334 RepID=UPI0037976145